MHEVTVAQSLLEMVEEELVRRHCSRLEMARVEYGALSGIVPESLQLCFEVMIKGTPHEGARLEMICLPLRLRCSSCGKIFGGEGQEALWQDCPGCGEQFGHVVEQGKELILKRLQIR